jgi:ABC-type polysaccharide/polyol phosphate export permease
MMKYNTMYDQDHKIAKFIIYVVIMVLVLIPIDSPLKELLAVTIWFWGLNPIAYLVESVRKHPHQHRKL